MKTAYFTAETIEAKTTAWLRRISELSAPRHIRLLPAKSALLILDVQRYFRDPSSHAYIPSLSPVIGRIRSLQQAYTERGFPVIFTRHANTAQDAGSLGTWWKNLITEGSDHSLIVDELVVGGCRVIKKTQYDAFHGTALEATLRDAGVTQVVVTGVMTHLCCETTARSAFVRGFTVFFPADGTATYNEEFHFASLLNLSHGFAVPLLCRDILARLEEEDRGSD